MLLNFENEKKSRPKFRLALFTIASFVIAGAVGSTLATDNSIDLGQRVEFGQGMATTSVCDDQITITPYSSFINGSGGSGSHYLASLRLSGIDSSVGKCSGKTFVIKVFGEDGLLKLFNYTETDGVSTPINEDYSSIEVTNYAGEFVWTSGGTDGDDVIDVNNDDITNTAFTVNLVSQAPTITRTPLALAASVTQFTIETYAKEELTERILSSSQVGIIIVPGFEDFSIFPYESAVVNSESCFTESCYPYIVLRDWIDVLLDHPDTPLTGIFTQSGLGRAEFAAAATVRLESIEGENPDSNWIAYLSLPGQDVSDVETISGSLIGFNGSTAVFATPFPAFGAPPLVVSLDRPLTEDSVIGSLDLFVDALNPVEPISVLIRNLFSIWDFPQTP